MNLLVQTATRAGTETARLPSVAGNCCCAAADLKSKRRGKHCRCRAESCWEAPPLPRLAGRAKRSYRCVGTRNDGLEPFDHLSLVACSELYWLRLYSPSDEPPEFTCGVKNFRKVLGGAFGLLGIFVNQHVGPSIFSGYKYILAQSEFIKLI